MNRATRPVTMVEIVELLARFGREAIAEGWANKQEDRGNEEIHLSQTVPALPRVRRSNGQKRGKQTVLEP